VIAIVAMLGTMEPAMHEPIAWPFGSVPSNRSAPEMPAGHLHQE
jgi:hypothetical protein